MQMAAPAARPRIALCAFLDEAATLKPGRCHVFAQAVLSPGGVPWAPAWSRTRRSGPGLALAALVVGGATAPQARAGSPVVPIRQEDALPGRAQALRVSDRHYVLGTPMRGPWPPGLEVFVFANGCFWGSEKGIWRLPGGGVHSTAVGYAAGFTPNPTYEEVVSGGTGAAEAVQVVFDPRKIGLVDLLRWGTAADFDEGQRELFEASRRAYEEALREAGKGGGPVTTEILAAADFPQLFYYAEDWHQQYLAKPGARPYCSAQPLQVPLPPFERWGTPALLANFSQRLPEAFWSQHAPKPHGVVKAPTAPIAWSPDPSELWRGAAAPCRPRAALIGAARWLAGGRSEGWFVSGRRRGRSALSVERAAPVGGRARAEGKGGASAEAPGQVFFPRALFGFMETAM
ncbi:unnamed protein product [Prorocentrum cordatum]|uniref:peptide-methionine (S)-S-oxide reductase n=1 Tax=Prorocentrum cordatum TaxID=2364126 RepID=A0ABN9Y919_9DINO|nr:unnamed protein product [Polarella glacialis]